MSNLIKVKQIVSGTNGQILMTTGGKSLWVDFNDTYVSGMTFNNTTYDLTLDLTSGASYTESLAILANDVKVTGGTYNGNNIISFKNSTGGTFDVTGLTSGMTDTNFYTTNAYLSGNNLRFDRTDTSNAFSVDLSSFKDNTDTYVTGGTYNGSTTLTFKNSTGGTFNVGGLSSGDTSPYKYISTNSIIPKLGTNFIGSFSNSTIAGGENNTAGGSRSFIGGGRYNTIDDDASIICGGEYNEANSVLIFVGGGTKNIANDQFSGIVAGSGNTTTNDYGIVVGGKGNDTNGEYAVIVGGNGNDINGEHSFIGSGNANDINSSYSFIGGGITNTINSLSSNSFIGSGQDNVAGGSFSSVVGGESNTSNGDYSIIGGGDSNTIEDIYSTIGGGSGNYIDTDYDFIGGGSGNEIYNSYSVIGGGESNVINSTRSAILGGGNNTVSGSYSAIVIGVENTINSSYGAILNGSGNTLASGANNSVILGRTAFSTSVADTTFVDYLNINRLKTTASVEALGRDADGFVVPMTGNTVDDTLYTIKIVSADRSMVVSDKNAFIKNDNTIELTFQNDSTWNVPIGSSGVLKRTEDGDFTVTAGAGVTINNQTSVTFTLNAIDSQIAWVKSDNNMYEFGGDYS